MIIRDFFIIYKRISDFNLKKKSKMALKNLIILTQIKKLNNYFTASRYLASDPSKNRNAKKNAKHLSEKQQQQQHQDKQTTDTRASKVPPASIYTGLSGKKTEIPENFGGEIPDPLKQSASLYTDNTQQDFAKQAKDVADRAKETLTGNSGKGLGETLKDTAKVFADKIKDTANTVKENIMGTADI
jgi:hypothetical protein